MLDNRVNALLTFSHTPEPFSCRSHLFPLPAGPHPRPGAFGDASPRIRSPRLGIAAGAFPLPAGAPLPPGAFRDASLSLLEISQLELGVGMTPCVPVVAFGALGVGGAALGRECLPE